MMSLRVPVEYILQLSGDPLLIYPILTKTQAKAGTPLVVTGYNLGANLASVLAP